MTSSSRSTTRHRKRPPSRRRRCNARIKNGVSVGKDGKLILRPPRCQAWAMPNGKCKVHGGLSTGPKSDEGMARTVAAMVAGRKRWLENWKRTSNMPLPCGRMGGAEWIGKEARGMARDEAKRLGFTITPDCPNSTLLELVKLAKARNPPPTPEQHALAKREALSRELIKRERRRSAARLRWKDAELIKAQEERDRHREAEEIAAAKAEVERRARNPYGWRDEF